MKKTAIAVFFFTFEKMIKLQTATPRWIIVVLDLLISVFSLGLSYFIRFDLNTNLIAMKTEWLQNWPEFITYISIKGVIFYLFSIHKEPRLCVGLFCLLRDSHRDARGGTSFENHRVGYSWHDKSS